MAAGPAPGPLLGANERVRRPLNAHSTAPHSRAGGRGDPPGRGHPARGSRGGGAPGGGGGRARGRRGPSSPGGGGRGAGRGRVGAAGPRSAGRGGGPPGGPRAPRDAEGPLTKSEEQTYTPSQPK